MKAKFPRLVVAGTKGDSGKTIVSLGLSLALRERGIAPTAFKKGPDFIDAAWLGWASQSAGRNLDTYMMGAERVYRSFFQHADRDQVNLIEGSRGIHDGSDPVGTHSTAELAKLLQAPTVLVLPITKTTRTAAAMVLGCKMLDPDLNIAGVILNHYAGPRHKRVTTQAIEQITGIPVVGAIPKLDVDLIPNRHLGLKTLVEHDHTERVKDELLRVVNDYLDMDKIIEIAKSAPAINLAQGNFERKTLDGAGLNIGVVSDEAFSFYYAENIEALEDAGAKIVRISATAAQPLPENIDALFIGGGFPEMHLEKICANRRLLNQVKEAADNGLPIYAECGGLMFLSKSIQFQGANYPMAGVFPVELGVSKKPKGHGYCEVNVDRENPFFKTGTLLRGHEFHYSYIHPNTASGETAFEVKRGTGCFDKRDGLIYKNAMASYLHLHAIGSPEWAKGLMSAAQEYRHTQIGHRAGTISFDHRHASGQG